MFTRQGWSILKSQCILIKTMKENTFVYRLFSKRRIVVDSSPSIASIPKQPVVQLNPYMKVRELAKRSFLPSSHIIKALCTHEGKYYYLNDSNGNQHCFEDERDIVIPFDISNNYMHRCKKDTTRIEIDPENIQNENMNYSKTIPKRLVFSVVGEMDHGKTTLLDHFLNTSFQKKEFGGTTQIIRATDAILDNIPCTFLDTPGQACFSYIRDNGSILSDITLYIVSLAEGPSEEARSIFAQLHENSVPVITILTKSDLVSEQRIIEIKNQLHHLANEFDVTILNTIAVSSITKQGFDLLQDQLLHYGSQYQKHVPFDVPAEATILDSALIPSQGLVFRALIQQGCLQLRNEFICGLYTGRIRNIINLQSKSIEKATPGMVVNVLGARKLPANLRKNPQLLPSGDTLFVRKKDEIDKIWNQRMLEYTFKTSLVNTNQDEMDDIQNANMEIIDGEEYYEVPSCSVILVSDNANSMNILLDYVSSFPNVHVEQSRVGQILNKDVSLCKNSKTKLISYNVPLPKNCHLGSSQFIYSQLMSDLLPKIETVIHSVLH